MKRLLLIPLALATAGALADEVGDLPMLLVARDGQAQAAALLGGPQRIDRIVIGSSSRVTGERARDAQAQAAALLSRSR